MTRPVLHIASGREWRGGERQVWLLTRALARLGVPQRLVTARHSVLARQARAAGIAVTEVPWDIGLDPRALLSIIRQTRAGEALVHAHDPHALRLGLLSRARRTPLVATRRVTFPIRPRGTWQRADHVIAISAAVAGALRTGGVAPGRITIIPSGVALDDLARITASGIRERLGWPADTPLVVNVAALTREKGHDLLLRTAAAMRNSRPSLRWVVAGDGPQRAPLARLAQELGVRDTVRFMGHVDLVAPLLADATVVVSASSAEGLGSTLIDAMALARPIVATAVGGVPELLSPDAGLLVPPGDPVALASAVERLLASADAAAALGRRARLAADGYGIERMAERTREVYRSLMMATERT
jgi:glycosyltransferase involved in cell wall biosynthesis